MPGEEDEAVHATIADIMAKTSGVENNDLPSSEPNLTNIGPPKKATRVQKQQPEAVKQPQHQNGGSVDLSTFSSVANPLSVCSGGRRSTSADSERSLRLVIAESGGCTSGAESSPLATPAPTFDNGCDGTLSLSTCGRPNAAGAADTAYSEVGEKTPMAETATTIIANKANDLPFLEDTNVHKKQQSTPVSINPPAVFESNKLKLEQKKVAVDESLDADGTSKALEAPAAATGSVSASVPAAIGLPSSVVPQTTCVLTNTSSQNTADCAFTLTTTVPVSSTLTNLSLITTDATTAATSSPTAVSSSVSTFVTVSIAGKSAASITAAAAAARSTPSTASGSSAAPTQPPTLALMRAPIQPTPVTRILPRPTAKKQTLPQTQQQKMNATAATTAAICSTNTTVMTTSTATTMAPAGTTISLTTKQTCVKSAGCSGGGSIRAQLTGSTTPIFSGTKTTSAVLANGTVTTAPTKFAAVVSQRVGATGGSCVAVPALLGEAATTKESKNNESNARSSSSNCTTTNAVAVAEAESASLGRFADTLNDTVNRVAAGAEISPPHPLPQQQQSMPQPSTTQTTTMPASTTTTASSAATTPTITKAVMVLTGGPQFQPQQQCGSGAGKGQQLLKPRPPKKKKTTAPKAKNALTIADGGVVDEVEQRNASVSVVDMQQQQTPSTASVFPVCSAVSSSAPAGGMFFPPNFALAAAPNGGTAGASVMAAYPSGGGSGGGIAHYFIRQTTASGHQQLIPVTPALQQFFFSPMPAAEATETSSSTAANIPLTAATPAAAITTHLQAQTADEQQQRVAVQQQQHIRNVYFRSGNDIFMPAMVSSNGVGSGAAAANGVGLPSASALPSQNSVDQQNFVASSSQQHRPSPPQQQKGTTTVGVQPRGTTTTAAARTPIAPKGSQTIGEGPLHAQPVTAPMVMFGGAHHPHAPYPQLPPSQHQYFLTPSGAIVTLQAPQHVQHQQQLQSFQPSLGTVRMMPSTSSSNSSGSSTALATPSADVEQRMHKNGLAGTTSNSFRPTNSLTAKVSSSKRKRKMDAKSVVPNALVAITADTNPSLQHSQHQMDDQSAVVDEEENEPPPVLCRVFNRSEEEPIVSTAQSMESVFQREAKVIRERMFDANGTKFGPLKHFIDGFEIEEDIEPFPCEHRQLLDRLKREQAGLEAEIGCEATTASPEKDAQTMFVENAVRRKGRKRTATASSAASSSASSPTRSPKTPDGMEPTTCDRTAEGASATGDDKKLLQKHQPWLHDTTPATDELIAEADDSAEAAAAAVVKKGRRRELDGLLKMDFGKNSPFQTSDPDKYAQEVLIEARQQQRTLALAQEEQQRNARRSVESSGGGSTTGGAKSSKRDKHAKKPFSPPVSPLPESRSASAQPATATTVAAKSKNCGEKVSSSSSKFTPPNGGKPTTKEATTAADGKLKSSPKDSLSSEQRRSGGSNASEEGEERCLYCRRSFKEVPRDKDHVQYCSKACRKQLKASKRMKLSGGSLEDALNSSTGMTGNETKTGNVLATPSHRRSDPSSSSDSSGQQQQSNCHITSPLGSAFSAMQPQMLSKRRLPVDQHAEQLMSMNQRLSGGNGSGTSFVPPPFGQSPPADQTAAMLAVPMAIRPTPGALPTMIQYGTPTAMYFNTAAHHQMVVSSSAEQQQQTVAAHTYQQQQQQQHLLYAAGTMAGSSQQHFFAPTGPSGAHPGTPTPFLSSSSVARQSSLNTVAAPSSSPATPVPTPTSFMERNSDIEALVAHGVHTWTKEEVSKWVNFVTGSDSNGDRFVDEDVDGTSLLCLSQEQLKTELKFKLGPAIKLWSALEVLKRNMMC